MKVAIIVPCLNEELTIGKVVADSLRHLPEARVFVLDNGSTDQTATVARAAGAEVIHSPLRGKGHAIRHALRLIDADHYIMVDGDGTYPMDHAPRLLALSRDLNYEMVMGTRLQMFETQAFRPMHYAGNLGFTGLVRLLFGFPVKDLLTGYRVFSRRFVEEVQFVSSGFEIETELTIRAVAQNMAFVEVPIPYTERPAGSRSKLRTFRDGWVILRTVFRLLRGFRLLMFYTPLALLCFACSVFGPRSFAWSFSLVGALFMAMGFYFATHLDLERFKLRHTNSANSGTGEKPFRRSA